ncbi:MAG: hypothetical protein IJS09_11110 [Treponema sp.]|nr:hypothetical protein [Treponema sp.]
MFRNKKGLIVTILCLFVALSAFAQSTSNATMALLQRADDAYTATDYQKAFGYITAALKMNETEYRQFGVAPNVALLAKQIFRRQLQEVAKTKNYSILDDVSGQLEKFPDIADLDLNQQIKRLQDQRALDLRAQERAEDRKHQDLKSEKDREALAQSLKDFSQQQEEERKKDREYQQERDEKLFEQVGKNNETIVNAVSKGNHTVLIAILIICAILVVVFVIVVFSIVTSSRAAAHQRAQFDATLKLVAGMQQQNTQLLLGGVTDINNNLGGLRSAGSSRWGMDALPAPEMNDEEKVELKDLAIKCEELGSQIDQISKRKNNSKNVSELVFKLATHLGLNQNTSMMYFCAAMVYDIGFLDLPDELLNADNLSDEQRQQLRTHLTSCDEKFGFVPEKYRQIFIDASKSHHENMDGTGYPQGLEGENIPQIARLIHVAESFTALISRRSYRAIMDKESAIEDMKSKPGLYDPDVVACLDAIV